MSDASSPMAGFLLLAIAFIAYFLPTFISAKRDHPNGTGIFLLNLFLGWTFIGWLAALIWSVSALKKPESSSQPVTSEPNLRISQLQTLAALRDKGILTEDEFEAEKAKLLQS